MEPGRPVPPPVVTPVAATRTAPAPRPPVSPEALAESPFTTLGLAPALVRAVVDEGYVTPTPIQAQVIPHVLAGRDVLGIAQTGTGKTAAFVLPLLHALASTPAPSPGSLRLLILAPTRELAAQIAERVEAYGRHFGIRYAVVFGGVSQHRQELALKARPEVLVATPGRLLDLLGQGVLTLRHVEHLVLDEADRMLDMGFVKPVRTICSALVARRQTLLFSATLPKEVDALARSMLRNPTTVTIARAGTAAGAVTQGVIFLGRSEKRARLEEVLRDARVERALVFTRTKHGANRLVQQLDRSGIRSAALHGNKSQAARERALDAFRSGQSRVLVATDVASRGIDVEGISHVINYELPDTPDTYVHRIGRTGRAGATGEAISFCDPEERPLLADIERLLQRRIAVIA